MKKIHQRHAALKRRLAKLSPAATAAFKRWCNVPEGDMEKFLNGLHAQLKP